jgi:PAS domain S-box-containing protein
MSIDKNKYNILVVEDNPGDFLLIEDYLQEHILDPALIHVKNFRDAQELLNNGKHKIDVVLLDLSLPDISKEELILKLSPITHSTPVIILTGYSDVEFATRSLSVGVSDYLLKDTITPLVLYKSILYSKERHLFFKSLFDSEKKYMDLFELNPNPLWVFDPETYEFLEANKAAVDLYGYTKEEFLNMTLKDIRPPEDVHLIQNVVNKILTDKKNLNKDIAYRHRKKDGSIIYVEISNNVIEYNGKKAIIAIATDVTEKRSHIEAIKEQNTKLKEIAWMQSHVVRAPLSRLMSIIDVIKGEHLTVDEKEFLLNQVVNSSNEIDLVIRDIVEKAEQVIKEIK